jgi:tetratricopeptide (TPR) repeat protein
MNFKEKLKNWIPVRDRTNPPWRTFAGMTKPALQIGAVVFLLFGALPVAHAMSIDEINKLLAALPANDKGLQRGTLNMEMGRELYRLGRMAEAAQAYETALQFDTSKRMRRTIYLYLAKSYESSNQPEKATKAYEEALARDKRNWRRHRDLGLQYETLGRYDDAVARYERALRLEPSKTVVMMALARTYRKMGLAEYAEDWLKKALAANHRASEVDQELSYVYEMEGRYPESAQVWMSAIGPGLAPVDQLCRLVYLGLLSNDPVLVKKAMKRVKAARKSKDTGVFYENLVQLLTQHPDAVLLGKTPNAIRDWLFSTAGL